MLVCKIQQLMASHAICWFLCVYLGTDLNIHTMPENLTSARDTDGISNPLLQGH